MSNLVFFVLLGSVSAVGIGLGYPWEPIAAVAGAVMSVFALIKAEVSERILRHVAKEIRVIGDLRRDLRGRLSGLIRRVCRPSSREPPGGACRP